MDNKPEINLKNQTPKNLLLEAIKKTNELDNEAGRNLVDSTNILRVRAQIVADLPKKIEEAIEQTGQKFPADQLETIKDLSQMAQEALENGNRFAMAVLLHEKGSKIGEPNSLELIADELNPKKRKK